MQNRCTDIKKTVHKIHQSYQSHTCRYMRTGWWLQDSDTVARQQGTQHRLTENNEVQLIFSADRADRWLKKFFKWALNELSVNMIWEESFKPTKMFPVG